MPRPKLSWVGKFRVAFRGVWRGMTGQASFAVHVPAALGVAALGLWLQISLVEWTAILFSIGLVFTAELFNSAIEELFRGLPDEKQDEHWPALDIAAGAVLVASLTAAGVGCIVFIPRMWQLLQ